MIGSLPRRLPSRVSQSSDSLGRSASAVRRGGSDVLTVERRTVTSVGVSSEPLLFDLHALSERAGVTPRTVRYYIQQGLLRSPGSPGPGAKYDEGHLGRLRLIRLLQREHLPLAEIRRRIESLADDEVGRLLAQTSPPDRSSAVEYVRSVLQESPRLFVADSAGAPEPPPAAGRAQWDRITLTPDLELHVRRPLSRLQNRMVEKLLDCARRLLEEDAP